MDRFDFKPTSLTDLISTHYFNVPRYQRSYAWEEDHIDNFWEDLQKSIHEGGDYFLGNIVLTPSSESDRYSIIDGQQRIATTTILHAAMRDKYVENGHDSLANTIENQMICVLDAETNEKSVRIKLNQIDNPFYKKNS